jgi:hypothetical protein
MSDQTHRELLHLPEVVAQLVQIATNIATQAETGHTPGSYGVVLQNKKTTKRARALVHPTSGGGIHLELTQHLMLKAAIGNTNKTINAKASATAITMSNKVGDSGGVVVGGTLQPTTSPIAAP